MTRQRTYCDHSSRYINHISPPHCTGIRRRQQRRNFTKYRIRNSDYCEVKSGLTVDETLTAFNLVKQVFPLEDQLLTADEIDDKELRYQWAMASFGCSVMLGLRTSPRPAESPHQQVRLALMLQAFGSSKRDARYEADLVACWASMCNVSYQYDKNDSLDHALRKVKFALRKKGVPNFDFLPEQVQVAGPDPPFFGFSSEQRVVNVPNNAGITFRGIPVLTGRADTVHFLMELLGQIPATVLEGVNISDLFAVEQAQITLRVPLLDVPRVKALFSSTVTGAPVSYMFDDVTGCIVQLLEALANRVPQVLLSYHILQVSIPTISQTRPVPSVRAWALCPCMIPSAELKIVRESVNGVIALVAPGQSSTQLVSYVVLSDHNSGTMLLRSSADGEINMIFDTPKRRSIRVGVAGGPLVDDDRLLNGQIAIGKQRLVNSLGRIIFSTRSGILASVAKPRKDSDANSPTKALRRGSQ